MGSKFGFRRLLFKHRDFEFRALLQQAMPLGEMGSQTNTFIKFIKEWESSTGRSQVKFIMINDITPQRIVGANKFMLSCLAPMKRVKWPR